MKAWRKSLLAVACSGAILSGLGLGTDPVQAKALNPQTVASVVLLQPQYHIPFRVQFADGFKVNVTNEVTKAVSTFDVSANKATYVRQGVYLPNGKLAKQMNGFSEKLVELVPYYDAAGNLRWRGQQKIWGVNGEDRIAIATSVWNIVNQKPQLISVSVQKGDWDNLPSVDVEINSGFSMGKDITRVLDTKYADVTGDGVADHILLVGDKMGNAMNLRADHLVVVVREGKNNQQTFISVGNADSGHMPKLAITQGNPDGIKDILVTIPNPAGDTYSLLTWKDNHPAPVVDQASLNNRSVYQPVIGPYGEAVAMKKVR
ncbi:hypothetical protein ACFSO0_06180 [Brevibacillus sp. GCM10020057]|uniref:hypothetical protein n=1 Tax=Brevibacillus sp. GCM10020057 TaxID=3317327 RepID=UPI003644696B